MCCRQAERRTENDAEDFPEGSSCQGSGKKLLAIDVGVLCVLLRDQQKRFPRRFPNIWPSE